MSSCAIVKALIKTMYIDSVYPLVYSNSILSISANIKKAKKRGSGMNKRPIPKASALQGNQLLQMLSKTKELPIGLSTFKTHADAFIPKPWFNNFEGFTEEQASQVDEETKDCLSARPAACKAWHQHRVGRITSSTAHRVVHTSLETPSQTLRNDWSAVTHLPTHWEFHPCSGARTTRWMP